MALKYQALVHVAIRANCYETMYDFYVNKLGGREIFHLNYDCRPQYKGNEDIWLTYICFGKGQYVEMFTEKYVGDNVFGSQSFRNLCIEIGNMTLALKNLEALNIPIYDAPNGNLVLPPYAEIKPDECGALSVYVRDPEGNWVELQQFMPSSMQIVCG